MLTLREKLDMIDGWLQEEHGLELWAVLTALREYDKYPTLKHTAETVGKIRVAAFPRFFGSKFFGFGREDEVICFNSQGIMYYGGKNTDPPRFGVTEDEHFGHHVMTAWRVLSRGFEPKKEE